MHIDSPTVDAVADAIVQFHGTFPNLHQQVTEMDISTYLSSDNTSNYGANGGAVPPSIIAEQGWLYYHYFKAFRRLKGILDAVTFWGLADDDTWLDSFPISRLDEPLPFDKGLQAKPAYWGIIKEPSQLPGFGLNFQITSRTGPKNARVWTISANNPSSGTAYATQINGLSLTQVSGPPCGPVITPPSSYPVVLGDIAASDSTSASFTINFNRCSSSARFTLRMPWTSAMYERGTFVLQQQTE